MQRVWFITGTSTGMGRDLTLAALKRGDKVIATARGRSFAKLADLKEQGAEIMELDVNASLDVLHAAAKKAVDVYGHVDVVVNNAGYIESGTLEETTPEETLNQFNTNVFAPLNINRAFLPYMRARKTGTIVWIGSIVGWQTYPASALYCSTKFAVRSLSEALHQEISPFGLRSICFDLGYFRTSFLADGHREDGKYRIEDYRAINERYVGSLAAVNGKQPGNPKKGVDVMLDVIRGEGIAAGRPTPLVLGLGSDIFDTIKGVCDDKLKQLDEWKDVMYSTDFADGK